MDGLTRRVAALMCAVGMAGCGAAYSRRHVVTPAETLPDIARAQGVDEKELRAFNHLAPGDRVKPGDVVFVPGPPGRNHPVSTPRWTPTSPAGVPRPSPPEAAAHHPAPASGDKPILPPPPRPSRGTFNTAGALGWPLKGPVLREFGEGSSGANRGIDIGAVTGTEVHAAAAGRVSYAGRPARAYEPLVILDHQGDLHTVYGNLGQVRVQVGESVAGGAVLGISGRATGGLPPHVHFEVRETAEPLDPRLFLPLR